MSMKRYDWISPTLGGQGWGFRHLQAIHTPHGAPTSSAEWGASLRKLLNGDLGRLDAGTLEHIIVHNLEEQGFNPDDY